MPTTRVMEGLADMTGQQCNTLDIVRLVARRPEPTYEVRCTRCRTSSTAPHSRLRTGAARCVASGCGKVQQHPRRDLLTEQRNAATKREAERRAEEQAASVARMKSETADYKLPSRQRPLVEHVVLSERDRIAARQHREEVEAQERAEREQREKPVRELTAKINATQQKITTLERRVLTDPNVKDPDFWSDPFIAGMADWIAPEGIEDWNVAAFKNFLVQNPNFIVSDRNLQIFNAYFSKHQAAMFTEEMLSRVYRRMLDCNVEFDQPAPEPPEPTSDAINVASVKEPAKPEPLMFQGFDLVSGEPRLFSEREIDRMTADEMRKALQMKSRGQLELPRTGPGPRGRQAV